MMTLQPCSMLNSDQKDYRLFQETEVTLINAKHATLVIHLLDAYKDGSSSDEEFLEKKFEQLGLPESEHFPVAELFFSALAYAPLLNIVLENFYQQYKNKRREDATLMRVTILLVLLFLRKNSANQLTETLWELNGMKAWKLLKLLTSEKGLVFLVADACVAYLPSFIRTIVAHLEEPGQLGPMLRDELNRRIEKEKESKKRRPTIPVEFRFHGRRKFPDQPPPTPVTVCSSVKYAKPLPVSTFKKPYMKRRLEEMFLKNKTDAIYLYEEAQRLMPNCAKVRPAEVKSCKEAVEKIAAERRTPTASQTTSMIALASDTDHVSSQLPSSKRISGHKEEPLMPVKVNATTILREGARLIKEEEKEMKRLRDVAAGHIDPAELERLLEEREEKEEQEYLADIERKHLKGLLTREEAVLAKQELLRRNRERGMEMLREKEELAARLEEMRAEEEERIRQQVEKTRATEMAAREAQSEVLQQKQRLVQELNEESRARMEKAFIERDNELQRKMALIREVRALQQMSEATRANKQFDFTESSGVGLLCEMSIAELKDRLQLLRINLQDELQKRQDASRKERERQQCLIQVTKDFIEDRRKTAVSRTPSTKTVKKKLDIPVNKELEYLRRQLEEKREIRKKLQEVTAENINSTTNMLYN